MKVTFSVILSNAYDLNNSVSELILIWSLIVYFQETKFNFVNTLSALFQILARFIGLALTNIFQITIFSSFFDEHNFHGFFCLNWWIF